MKDKKRKKKEKEKKEGDGGKIRNALRRPKLSNPVLRLVLSSTFYLFFYFFQSLRKRGAGSPKKEETYINIKHIHQRLNTYADQAQAGKFNPPPPPLDFDVRT